MTLTTPAWGLGLATLASDKVLDVWFPTPALGTADGAEAPAELVALVGDDEVRGVRRVFRLVEVDDLQA